MITVAAAAADDEDGFSDVSSICLEEQDQAYVSPPVNRSRWLGRAAQKEKFEKKEAERRKRIEDIRLAEEERKERELAAYAAREEEGETASQGLSEAESGLSDVSGEAEDRDVTVGDVPGDDVAQCGNVDGPDITNVNGTEDVCTPAKPSPTLQRRGSFDSSEASAFGSSSEDEEEPQSPTVVRTSDDSTRVELQIQGCSSASSSGEPCRVVVRLRSDWAPLGVARFMELVEAGFYHGTRVHRCVKGVLAQFGLPVDPALYEAWKSRLFADDANGVKVENSRGTLSFASREKHSRCCQVFMNLSHNKGFDEQGFAPFAEVVQGMDVFDDLFAGYGEPPPKGTGPNPELIKSQGAEYLKKFPTLSWITSARVLSRSGDEGYGMTKRTSLKKDKPASPGEIDLSVGSAPQSPTSPMGGKRVSFQNEALLPLEGSTSRQKRPSSPTLFSVSSPRAPCVGDSLPSAACKPERIVSPVGSGLMAAKALSGKRSNSL